MTLILTSIQRGVGMGSQIKNGSIIQVGYHLKAVNDGIDSKYDRKREAVLNY